MFYRQFITDTSDYFLSNTYVDTFKDEVQRPARAKEELEDEILAEDDGYVMETDDPQLKSCASNWKAATVAEKKKMWGIFDKTGVFASACPHGFILWLVDMVQSGELHVYSLIHPCFPANLCLAPNIHWLWSPKRWTPSARVF
jgi:hypothetical protein